MRFIAIHNIPAIDKKSCSYTTISVLYGPQRPIVQWQNTGLQNR